MPACLSSGALGLGDAPDGLLEDDALLERQAPAEAELAPPTRPGHAQRAPLIERLVIRHRGRGERARGQRDRAGRLADRDAREFGVGLGGRALGGGCDLIERQRAVLSAWSSAGRLRSALLVRVICAALRWSLLETCASHCALEEQPAACQSPSSSASRTISRDALLDARLLLAERTQLTPPRLAPTLPPLIDRPIQTGEHTFASYQHRARRKCADSVPNAALFASRRFARELCAR